MASPKKIKGHGHAVTWETSEYAETAGIVGLQIHTNTDTNTAVEIHTNTDTNKFWWNFEASGEDGWSHSLCADSE